MTLTKDQQEQLALQLQMHHRDPGDQDFVLNESTTLRLHIDEGVFGSDFMTAAVFLARYLHENPGLYKGRKALDLGCGAGIQGIIMSRQGAKQVMFSDLSPRAAVNTDRNTGLLNLKNTKTVCGDLFQGISRHELFETIVFNHPFFPEEPELFGSEFHSDIMIRKTMLGGTKLIQRFFTDVGDFLDKDGIIIMPYLDLAGVENDPGIVGRKFGYDVKQKVEGALAEGVQFGKLSITILARRSDLTAI